MPVYPDILNVRLLDTHHLLDDSPLHDPDALKADNQSMAEQVNLAGIEVLGANTQEGAGYPVHAERLDIVPVDKLLYRSCRGVPAAVEHLVNVGGIHILDNRRKRRGGGLDIDRRAAAGLTGR